MPLWAQQPVGEEFAARLAPARQRCAGEGAPPMAWSAKLDEAARQASRGEPLVDAATQAGFRPTQAVHIRVRGPGSVAAAASFVADQYCQVLAERPLTGLGVARDGASWSIVLAAPLVPPAQADTAEVAARVLRLVNEARAKPRQCGSHHYGVAAPLRPNTTLDRAAALHAQDMAKHAYLAHKGRDGHEVGTRATRVGYAWRAIGENIAAGQAQADEVVRDWLASPGHCANIMAPDYTEMGIAFAANLSSKGGVYWTQVFGRPQ